MPSFPTTPIAADLSLTPTPQSARTSPPMSPSLQATVGVSRERVFVTRQIPFLASPIAANTFSPSSPSSPSSSSNILSQTRFSYTSPRLTSPFSTPGGRGRSRSQSSSNSRSSRKSPASDRFSDRFIPSRANVQSFHMNCPTHLLSSEEKLFRRSVSSSSRGRSVSPDSGNTSTVVSQRNSNGSPGAFRGTSINRRISAGAVGVFGIGISAATRGEEPRPRGREVHINVFGDKTTPEAEVEKHEKLLSAALGVDRSAKVLSFTRENEPKRDGPSRKGGVTGNLQIENVGDMLWEAVLEAGSRDSTPQNSPSRKSQKRTIPTTPFRVLDAPGLRDDYYCSLIAYSPHTHSLAVGLHSDVYIWTEAEGARPFEPWSTSHVTSLAFSCLPGRNNILAIGRIDGSLSLWSPIERAPRIGRPHNAGVACLAWKPTTSHRSLSRAPAYSRRDRIRSSMIVEVEELLVGDEFGNVYYYSIDWNGLRAPSIGASITLLKRIVVHSQQICGLAWSGDGEQFATGGNDNVACLFDVSEVVSRQNDRGEENALEGGEKHRWPHGAAVKAIAFCPWQKSLVATGGGSNDRCIHFFHTFSGATLATINVSAQVTSLLWSTSHREIAATFGYANPEHPVRIAVFSWPECKQVVQISWQEDMRALYAVAYPGGPSDPFQDSLSATSSASNRRVEDGSDNGDALREDSSVTTIAGDRIGSGAGLRWSRRSTKPKSEGCIVVAASDETVRFHEVWSETRRGVFGWRGVLGGSDILEGLEGIEKDGGEMIR